MEANSSEHKKLNITKSVYFRIILTTVLGLTIITLVFGFVNLEISKRIFAQTFVEAQESHFNHVESQFNSFYLDILDIITTADNSGAIQRFLEQEHPRKDLIPDIYAMQRNLNQTALAHRPDLYMMMIGTNGVTTYLHNAERLRVSPIDILSANVSKLALSTPGRIVSTFELYGFTETTYNEEVVVFAKTLGDSENIHGIIYVFMKESDFAQIYNVFMSDFNQLYFFNQLDELISSSDQDVLHLDQNNYDAVIHRIQDTASRNVHIVEQTLSITNYRILGAIDPDTAFQEHFHILNLLWLFILITSAIGFVMFLLIKKQLKPLQQLVIAMNNTTIGNLTDQVQVKGPEEIQRLTAVYNKMSMELSNQIEAQKDALEGKREAEINALQAQINPHFMYNTLTSVKWLIWKNDQEKSVQMLDAFIDLLRNTISNKEEFITMKQEVENLKNYVFINQMRFSDHVYFDFYLTPDCEEIKVPKLILQPFVENAFFHAFPDGRDGYVNVLIKKEAHFVKVSTVDNGVGISTERLTGISNGVRDKGELFTGIGINNVDERIKLIYGLDYGITIENNPLGGTMIHIFLPIR